MKIKGAKQMNLLIGIYFNIVNS